MWNKLIARTSVGVMVIGFTLVLSWFLLPFIIVMGRELVQLLLGFGVTLTVIGAAFLFGARTYYNVNQNQP